MKAPKYDDKQIKGLFENKPSTFHIDEKTSKKAVKKNEDAFKEKRDELLKPYTEAIKDYDSEEQQAEEEASNISDTDITDELDQLRDIQQQMIELLEEAKNLVRQAALTVGQRIIYERAASYWIGHMATALSNESEYAGRSMASFEDTINELEEAAGEEYEVDEIDRDYSDQTTD